MTTTSNPAHIARMVTGPEGARAACSCGWTSPNAYPPGTEHPGQAQALAHVRSMRGDR